MHRLALGDQSVVGLAIYLINKGQAAAADLGYLRPDRHQVLIISRRFIAALGFGDDHKSVFLILHLLVGETARTAQLAAPHLEPDHVIGIVNNAHLVGLGVADANLSFVPLVHEELAGRQGFEPR